MIIFKREHIESILRGQKTQTRRLGKKRWCEGSLHQCRVGYSAKPFANIRLLRVRSERLCDISNEDIRREGFPHLDRAQFLEKLRVIYGPIKSDARVWVIEFEVER